nr:AAA family ATPase [uncultured Butyrivibrio sp.]
MELNVVLDSIYKRDEKTGYSNFVAREGAMPIFCSGVILPYHKKTPIVIKGEYRHFGDKKTFVVSDCHMKSNGINNLKDFFSSGEFKGIGPAIANMIINSLGTDAFERVRKEDIESLVKGVGSNEDAIYRLLMQLKSITDLEDIYDYVKSIGCDYFCAKTLYNKFGKDAVNRVKNNPYILIYTNVPFMECEKIAYENKVEMCDKRRLRGIVEYIMTQNRNNGNTRMEFGELYSSVQRLEKKCGFYKTQPLFIAEEILSDRYHTEESGKNVYVYLKDDYDFEMDIARNIRRISISKSALKNDIPVEDIEKLLGVSYDIGQKEAFKCLETTGIKIVTGGPGTGKTTLLNGLLKKYASENKKKEVVLCAPTGCAARKMQEHTGMPAFTVHKLLGICPYEGKEEKKTISKLTADLVVLDEGSMVDNELMALLLRSLKNDVLLLIVGDADQIASVGAGNVFSDLIESGEIESYSLSHIFRQGNKSVIIDNSKKVLEGDKNLVSGKNFVIQRFDSEKEIVDKVVKISRQCEDKNISDIKVFTPSKNKKFAVGSIELNRALKKKSNDELIYGSYSFSVGDKVLFNKNNYDKGYFNGEDGVITSIQKHNNNTYVNVMTDDGPIFLESSELEDIELAYAITAHKSQGGECRNAIIVVPKKPASLLKRQLLYVEITRAKENVIILSEKDALEDAISSKFEFKRNTGLIEKLQSA